MKTNHVFTTLAFSALLGLGALAGLRLGEKEVKKADAVALTTVYLNAGGSSLWDQAGAKFSVHLWGTGTTKDVWMVSSNQAGVYKVEINDSYDHCIFIRNKNTATNPGFDDIWNQTRDLDFQSGKNLYTITGWGENDGSWSAYEEPDPEPAHVYKVSVNGGAAQTLVPGDGTQYCLASETTFAAGDELTFTKDDDAQSPTLKSDGTDFYYNNAELVSSVIKVKKAATANLYWDVSADTLWVNGANAVNGNAYLRGSFNSWEGIDYEMHENGDDLVYEELELEAGAILKAFVFNEAGADDDAKRAWIQPTSVESDHPGEYPVQIDGNNNAKVLAAGSYDLTIDKDGKYSFTVNNYVDPVHVITIAGNEIPLTRYDAEQFKVTASVTAGQTITSYTINGTEMIAAEGFGPKAVGNNNLTSDLKIIASQDNADIYYNVTTKKLWVAGLPLGGYHLLKSGHLVEMTAAGEYQGFDQYKSDLVSFLVGDTIKFVDTSGGEHGDVLPVVWAITKINEGGLGANFEVEDGVIKCKTACSASVYMKLKSGLDEVYFGAVPEYIEEAVNFAENFKDDLADACSRENKQSLVESIWSGAAEVYATLSDEAKAELKKADSSTEEIRDFVERYVGIMQQHKDWNLTNFLNLSIPESAHYTLTSFVSNNAMLIVVIAAGATICGLALLLSLKKRKHQ